MNCATHSNIAAVAYCRTCGKPLCAVCSRDVRGTIFCETCLADRLAGIVPPAPATAPPSAVPVTQTQPVVSGYHGGPNPAVAGMLAGFLPVGVGAVYNGQYAKGLAHLVIMVATIVALSSGLPWYLDTVLGISLGFFYFYQIIDAVRSAHAIQAGQPAPDPFGLAQTFGAGDSFDSAKVPVGATILIGLGLLFLLHTAGLFEFGFSRFWPVVLIFLGGWLFARRWGLVGSRPAGCQCDRCRFTCMMGPAILLTMGILLLLASLDLVGFGKTWPVLFLVIGGIKLMQSNASSAGHIEPPPVYTAPYQAPPPPPPAAPAPNAAPSGEVNHG
jgi:hypothetical protein